ncbi:hypothetical protein [Ascidiimonas aurantiaca]|uniref:hypothetical protein n=1 Tax=Ascidiimonas aurantiaca TaxID=1685432 RepID=UPI0030EBEB37
MFKEVKLRVFLWMLVGLFPFLTTCNESHILKTRASQVLSEISSELADAVNKLNSHNVLLVSRTARGLKVDFHNGLEEPFKGRTQGIIICRNTKMVFVKCVEETLKQGDMLLLYYDANSKAYVAEEV